jgi:hypothetical protein
MGLVREWSRGEYIIGSDARRLDIDVIRGFLVALYWAEGRRRERVVQSIERSLPFGLYHREEQVGFARVVTDYVVVAFLADVLSWRRTEATGWAGWLTSLPTLRNCA